MPHPSRQQTQLSPGRGQEGGPQPLCAKYFFSPARYLSRQDKVLLNMPQALFEHLLCMSPDHRGTKRSQIRSPKPRAERVQNRPIHRHGVDQRRPGSGVRGWGVTADGAPRAGQCGGCSAWRTRENAERRAQGERNSQCLKSVSTFT